MIKIGVLGPRGRLGSQLVSMGGIPLDVDITDYSALRGRITPYGEFDVVINCAAYTNVDGCEQNQDEFDRAMNVNFWGPNWVYNACMMADVPMIHLSTDYVFAGLNGPYAESYQLSKKNRGDFPKSQYGVTKYGAEVHLRNAPGVTIVRTTGLYGGKSDKPDFVKLVRQTLEKGRVFNATKTLRGNQTYIPHLATGLIILANNLFEGDKIPPIVHIASKEVITRYEFAKWIATAWQLDIDLVRPISSEEVPGWIAPRPTHGGLLTNLAEKLDIPIYTIHQGLQDALWSGS